MSTTATPKTDLLTLGQAADRLGCSYRWARELVRGGELTALNVGTTRRGPTWRVPENDLNAYLATTRKEKP